MKTMKKLYKKILIAAFCIVQYLFLRLSECI